MVQTILLGTYGVPKEVLIDEEDGWILARHSWRVNTPGYVYRAESVANVKTWLYLHRVITAASSEQEVDHVNRNRLDNRRTNLRICGRHENMRNTGKPCTNSSGLKGALFRAKCSRPWYSKIRINGGRELYLGSFSTMEEAHAAYCAAALKYHGEFACFG